MKLVRQTKLGFKEGNSDKVYEVDLCESGDKFLVNFRYGKRGSDLKEGTKTSSPVSREEADKIFQKLVDEKTRKGYSETGSKKEETEKTQRADLDLSYNAEERNQTILKKLSDANARRNPTIDRVIWRAGELKIKEAAPHIVNLIGTDKDLRDYCCAWALGFCGDENSVSAVENLQNHKSEMVKRIAFESLLKLSQNPQKLIDERFSQLPEDAKQVLNDVSNVESANNKLISFISNRIASHKKGAFTILEEIYAVAPKEFRPAVSEIIKLIPFKSKFFKTIRHIFKMAEYRRDAETYGIIAKRFERESSRISKPYWGDTIWNYDDEGKWRSIKYKEELASPDSSIAFSSATRNYFILRSWRTLRRLGEVGDTDYVKLAVGSLLAYSDADAGQPYSTTNYDYYHTGQRNWRNPKITQINYDAFASHLLFNHILYENSPRYEQKGNGLTPFRMRENFKAGDPAPDVREEAFPKLWEAQPVGLLHLLSESKNERVHEFAVKALRDCKEFLETLDLEVLKIFLASNYAVTANLGFELAKKFYDAANPDKELILLLLFSKSAEAQEQAFEWVTANKEMFAKDAATVLRILKSDSKAVREFGARLLEFTDYTQQEAQNLVGVLISEIVSFNESQAEIAMDFANAIFAGFERELKTINLNVALDLLKHPVLGVQVLGGRILANHETSAENLPNDLIDSLISSPYEEIRRIGIEVFGKLPEENLIHRESVIMNFLTHPQTDIYEATRPIVKRLAEKHPQFAETITNEIFVKLLEEESSEGLHSRLYEVLKDIPNWTKYANFEGARLLTKSHTSVAQEVGGVLLRENADEFAREIPVGDLIDFTNNEVLSVRKASWDFATRNAENLKEETSELIRALDTKFDDSREFWHTFFCEKLTEKELTPDVLVSISDSVKPETQKLGRDLLQKYFREENGAEYLLKLSEHPAPNMQLFATNYLENHAADSPEKLEKLATYFIRVFSLVNRARTAKERSLNFLETEALKSEEAAKIASAIFARQSATMAIGDRARLIQMMVKIRQKYPEIAMPINIKSAEVRVNAV